MIFLINLPPPLHGMSYINAKLLQRAKEKGLDIHIVNTTPSDNAKISLANKFLKHSYIFFEFCKVLKRHNGSNKLYRPINGGKGQLIDMAYLLLSKIFKYDVYIHHHSYNYLNIKSKLFSIICLILNGKAQHIVLSADMKEKLSDLYNIATKDIIVLSNIGFIDVDCLRNHKINNVKEKIAISYMANVTLDKGIDIFIKTCKMIDNINPNKYEFKIAGPIIDSNTKGLVDAFISEFKNAYYVGPVYGAQKEEFLNASDIFYFPSKYKNEAEPLVLYEAASCGCLVIGSQVGSMRDAIVHISGESFPLTINSNEEAINNFVKDVCNFICTLDKNELYLRKAMTKQKFDEHRLVNMDKIDSILDCLKN
ncbi:TPA: glycosyltransferase family 4 protein [Klebsiella quasipneumoniae subsp. quasipneumoniae]|nr:glycosyltransferase family 4 protein [Klebsiella quasipneumoniae subsp. quasipneumoniae]